MFCFVAAAEIECRHLAEDVANWYGHYRIHVSCSFVHFSCEWVVTVRGHCCSLERIIVDSQLHWMLCGSFQLIDAVGGVREAVTAGQPSQNDFFPSPPDFASDMNRLNLSGKNLSVAVVIHVTALFIIHCYSFTLLFSALVILNMFSFKVYMKCILLFNVHLLFFIVFTILCDCFHVFNIVDRIIAYSRRIFVDCRYKLRIVRSSGW